MSSPASERVRSLANARLEERGLSIAHLVAALGSPAIPAATLAARLSSDVEIADACARRLTTWVAAELSVAVNAVDAFVADGSEPADTALLLLSQTKYRRTTHQSQAAMLDELGAALADASRAVLITGDGREVVLDDDLRAQVGATVAGGLSTFHQRLQRMLVEVLSEALHPSASQDLKPRDVRVIVGRTAFARIRRSLASQDRRALTADMLLLSPDVYGVRTHVVADPTLHAYVPGDVHLIVDSKVSFRHVARSGCWYVVHRRGDAASTRAFALETEEARRLLELAATQGRHDELLLKRARRDPFANAYERSANIRAEKMRLGETTAWGNGQFLPSPSVRCYPVRANVA